MATIGYTTAGASAGSLSANRMGGAAVVASATGTLRSITAFLDTGSFGARVKAVLCDSSYNIIAVSLPFATFSDAPGEWLELLFETAPSVTSGQTYYLMLVADATLNYNYTATTGTRAVDTTNSYATPEAPTGATETTNTLMSIYATYSESYDTVIASIPDFRDGDTNVWSGSALQRGETFHNVDAIDLVAIQWCLRKDASPTGSCYAKLYAHTGTFGSTGVPTGAALATVTKDVSTLSATPHWETFTLDTPYELAANTDYCIVYEFSGGDATNKTQMARDGSSPVDDGNSFYHYLGSYTPQTTTSNLYRLLGAELPPAVEGGAMTLNKGWW